MKMPNYSEAELVQDKKAKVRTERRLRLTRDRNKHENRIKAVGIKEVDDTMVEDEEYGVLNLKRIRSLRDLQ